MKTRTLQQNKALHKYFEMLADELNDAGLDMRRTLKPEIDISWTGNTIKEYLWRPVMKAQLGKKSTTELTTKEIDLILNTLTRYLGEKHGLRVDWPSIESLIMKERTT